MICAEGLAIRRLGHIFQYAHRSKVGTEFDSMCFELLHVLLNTAIFEAPLIVNDEHCGFEFFRRTHVTAQCCWLEVPVLCVWNESSELLRMSVVRYWDSVHWWFADIDPRRLGHAFTIWRHRDLDVETARILSMDNQCGNAARPWSRQAV